ncbi:Oidioi.mRNA.OKI2018_I69.chr2.g7540.t2.cds [Oikopleura dioica]|uniref:Oidioi.mRNA.OKI2018_I69.chr2.g7540.t2.cds n=1 Tax=Oikopleura dioica TaxID=34765 RepID=A0ABN7T8U5_OIKDI|nr:Oidioi.mRNA.OKI2018_I69.chr2.g7540.t2.cds [Oikopleura dioica]
MTVESSEKRDEEKSQPPEIDKNKNSAKFDAKSKFFRRFRLTRSKSRQAADQNRDQDHPRIRRSNSLTQLPEPKYSVQDWLIKRRAVADEELYVGNTLMKQKQRLWVKTGGENRGSEKSCSLPAGNRLPESSDIEQILCRAARIRRRRDRSRSNDPLKKSEGLQSSTNQITADTESENYGSSNTLHSSTQISEDSFILSKKWRMHLNPEAGSISTDYDPNSSTIGESASSGYWSRGEKETDKEEIPEKTPLDLDLEKIRPESLRLPEQMRVHRTQHEQISQNHIGSRKDEGYFYVALVGDNSNADEQASRKSSLNSSYRVHSGYCESEEAEIAERRRRTRQCYAKLQQRRQSNDSLSSSCVVPVANGPRRSNSAQVKRSSPKIQSEDVKVEKVDNKDEWKITIKISCSQNNNSEENKSDKELEKSSTEKSVAHADAMTATVTQKQETQTQTSRCESPTRSDSPLVVKWQTSPAAPIIKTSKDVFTPNSTSTPKKEAFSRPKVTTVLPSLPTRPSFLSKIAPPTTSPASKPILERPITSRFQRKRTDFKSVLNQWQERASLSELQ